VALFRLNFAADPKAWIRGKSVYLRHAETEDFVPWARLRAESREFLTPWEPIWPADDLTRSSFRRRLKRHREEIARDESYPFLIFRQSDRVLLGGLTLGQVRRGVAQTATLGYWMGMPYANQGYMSDAVRAVLNHAFGVMGLRRVEAACLVHNAASRRLLERIGFQREGLARAYLQINGRWQDHVLYAILDSDVPSALGNRRF